ncbi:hypothetical protein [Azospirillum argentinense]
MSCLGYFLFGVGRPRRIKSFSNSVPTPNPRAIAVPPSRNPEQAARLFLPNRCNLPTRSHPCCKLPRPRRQVANGNAGSVPMLRADVEAPC